MIKVNPVMLPMPENDEKFREMVMGLLIDHGAQINTIHREVRVLVAQEVEKALADKFILINDLIKEAQEILGRVKEKHG